MVPRSRGPGRAEGALLTEHEGAGEQDAERADGEQDHAQGGVGASAEIQKVAALDVGADDYVTKPFDMEELLARLRAALRRGDQSPAATSFRIGRHEIDIAGHTIVEQGPSGPAGTDAERLHLTPTEWRLLEILLNAPGQLVGSDRLLSEVWGPGFERSTHYLRFHMAGLRRKLEDDPHRPRHLLTEPGMGYRYQP